MDYRITGKGVEISEAIKNYLEKRLDKVDRVIYDDELVSFNVRIERDGKNQYVVKFNMNLKGNIINVEERNPDIYTAIDYACDALEKQVKRLKERIKNHDHRKTLLPKKSEEPGEFTPSDKISSVRRVSLLNLDLDEAVMQLEELNHKFLVFRNVNTGEINMLYKGENGDIHLIEMVE
ncbi:ribosome hibernation-promoting factor, HPF/YfiA family [Thermotoga sp. KOL6]|uniref:ribosome hibernation-promoting factor, HPF/YfiA family n=1 Tax=Thermotoga sp. KOL6 TaxID=126741 RepID=UPI000C75FA2F|nr:ribosome-associated translation inhibitor RaiA [Thermotoga sp. KOL6]PLV60258.1 Fis family transcriptional regulator [Thermotoga sp. KOL6]